MYHWLEKNLQGDIISVYNNEGTKLLTYSYDAWGITTKEYTSISAVNTAAGKNPFTYRGYYFDTDLRLYYLQSRYYDANTGRFINADGYVSTGTGLLGYNMFIYCDNNPVNHVDPTGEAWYHWAIGAAIVVACAAAVVITAGGAAAGVAAVVSVANGVAAATTASTVAAGAFIGASVAYGSAVFMAASTSDSFDEFADEGDWGTVVTTGLATLMGGAYGYYMARSQLQYVENQSITSGTSRPSKNAIPNSRYLQYDQSTGQLRTDTVYDANGNWYSRVDYMHPHNINGIPYVPHIHYSAPLNQFMQPVGRGYVLPW